MYGLLLEITCFLIIFILNVVDKRHEETESPELLWMFQ